MAAPDSASSPPARAGEGIGRHGEGHRLDLALVPRYRGACVRRQWQLVEPRRRQLRLGGLRDPLGRRAGARVPPSPPQAPSASAASRAAAAIANAPLNVDLRWFLSIGLDLRRSLARPVLGTAAATALRAGRPNRRRRPESKV